MKRPLMVALCLLLLAACGGPTAAQDPDITAEEPTEVDVADLDRLTEHYVQPLQASTGIWSQDWFKGEDAHADDYIVFLAFNNLLGRARRADGGYSDEFAPAEAVEAALTRYFDIAPDYLRTSQFFTEQKGEPGYILPHGFGGGGHLVALYAERMEDADLHIVVGVVGPDNTSKAPAYTTTLIVRVTEEGFRYVGNKRHDRLWSPGKAIA